MCWLRRGAARPIGLRPRRPGERGPGRRPSGESAEANGVERVVRPRGVSGWLCVFLEMSSLICCLSETVPQAAACLRTGPVGPLNAMLLRRALILCFLQTVPLVRAEDGGSAVSLPFDRQRINRSSLDHLPRSLSLRQGTGVWLGYDLERGKLSKAWQAPDHEPGLVAKGFTTRSQGTTWHEDKTDTGWEYSFEGGSAPLEIRYLGCSDRGKHVDLRWELVHGERRFVLTESVSEVASPPVRAERVIQVDGLDREESIVHPNVDSTAWKFV